MQDSTVIQQAPPSQPSSIPSSAPAPTSASMSMPAANPVPTSYPTAPSQQMAPQVPQMAPQAPQVADPWQQAYQRLAANLNGTQPSQAQAQPWQQTPQAAAYPAYSPSAPVSYPQAPANLATPTWQPQAMPAYSPALPTAWPQQTPMSVPAVAPAAAPADGAADSYLSGVSDESFEVLNHFGAEAPALLNRYACTVEDALLQQAQQSTQALQQLQQLSQNLQQMEVVLQAMTEDNKAYNLLTTDPDLLARYVNEFFGPNGPVPVELPQDRLAAEVAAGGYNNVQSQPPAAPQQVAYQRPQMDITAPGGQPAGMGDFWSTFKEVANQRPDQAWRVLAQATPDAFRAKALISDQPPI